MYDVGLDAEIYSKKLNLKNVSYLTLEFLE